MAVKKETETKIPRLLRRREVESRTGLSRSSIYARMALKTFPASIDLGGRAVAWREDEVDQWVLARIAESSLKSEGAAVPCPA
jgi:prophage regulatory protein